MNGLCQKMIHYYDHNLQGGAYELFQYPPEILLVGTTTTTTKK